MSPKNADDWTRTSNLLLEAEFESAASTNSTTSASEEEIVREKKI